MSKVAILMVAENSWVSPGSPTNLSAHDVHVWCLKLEQPESCVGEFASILSGEERRRAARFRFERNRKRFVVRRGVLRTILAYYLNTEPDQLEFSYGAYGKPCVPQGSNEMAVQFNLAHSHELALYAIARGHSVGVDVEYVRHSLDVEEMSTRYLSEQENAVFKPLPKSQKARAFFKSWTRKEAYLKAIGTGLAQPLDGINVSATAGELPSVINTQGDAVGIFGWSIASFAPDPEYVAALAIEGHDWRLHRISSPRILGFSQLRNPSRAEPGWVRKNPDRLKRMESTPALCGLEAVVLGRCLTSSVSA